VNGRLEGRLRRLDEAINGLWDLRRLEKVVPGQRLMSKCGLHSL
jgi:hypothetical protein